MNDEESTYSNQSGESPYHHQKGVGSISSNSLDGALSKQPSVNSLAARLEAFTVSRAYESSLTKIKCGLCKMFFRNDSVNYKVANHRVIEIQQQWIERGRKMGVKSPVPLRERGKRFNSATFLYTEIILCSFCSQFFWSLRDENAKSEKDNSSLKDSSAFKVGHITETKRANVAEYQRAYQSSVVDCKDANWAITPPYQKASRTRREADPWWELDFGRFHQLERISFDVLVGNRQSLHVFVICLSRPVGFENPFLDNIQSSAILVKDFILPCGDCRRLENITWVLPSCTRIFAIRVQLKGVHILEVNNFSALEGDEIIMDTEADRCATANSFASVGPSLIKESLREMLKSRQKSTENESDNSKSMVLNSIELQAMSHDAVLSLRSKVSERYAAIEDWKLRAYDHATIFTSQEVGYLYKVVFKFVIENSQNVKDSLNEKDLLDSALLQFHPRCDPQDILQRIRSMVRWIQSRTQMKLLGPLLKNEQLCLIAANPHEYLYKLTQALNKVDQFWNLKEEQEKSSDASFSGSQTIIKAPRVAEIKGCSWSQFLIMISLFCSNRCEQIPYLAFHMDHPKAGGALDDASFDSRQDYQLHSHKISPAKQRSLHSIDKHRSMLSSLSLSQGLNSVELNDQPSLLMRSSVSRGRGEIKKEDSNLIDVARKSGILPYDSRFSEYKLSRLVKKLSKDRPFPKSLSLEFAASLKVLKGQEPEFSDGQILGSSEYLSSDSVSGSSSNHLAAANPKNFDDQSMNSSQAGEKNNGGGEDLPLDGKPEAPGPLLGFSARNASVRIPSLVRTTSKLSSMINTGSVDALSVPAHPHPSIHGLGKSTRHLGQPAPFIGSKAPSFRAPSLAFEGLGQSSSNPNLHAIASQPPHSASAPSTPLKLSAPPPRTSPTKLPSKGQPSQKDADSLGSFEDFEDDQSVSQHAAGGKEFKQIDFFRVCALCEMRFPRDCVDYKVTRKHVVKLRSTLDEKLVSKEVRSLDNTISMYNLVYVCAFCHQYFDPDFSEEGIAYPVRVAPPKIDHGNSAEAIVKKEVNGPMIPFYDTRYLPNSIDSGEVFKRPQTKELRKRAQRALEIVYNYERRAQTSPESPENRTSHPKNSEQGAVA